MIQLGISLNRLLIKHYSSNWWVSVRSPHLDKPVVYFDEVIAIQLGSAHQFITDRSASDKLDDLAFKRQGRLVKKYRLEEGTTARLRRGVTISAALHCCQGQYDVPLGVTLNQPERCTIIPFDLRLSRGGGPKGVFTIVLCKTW
jgi:hypothetical protein